MRQNKKRLQLIRCHLDLRLDLACWGHAAPAEWVQRRYQHFRRDVWWLVTRRILPLGGSAPYPMSRPLYVLLDRGWFCILNFQDQLLTYVGTPFKKTTSDCFEKA
jgi:hypothetical protein